MPEHQNIEYKESWRDEYLKWICGFENLHKFIGRNDIVLEGQESGGYQFKRGDVVARNLSEGEKTAIFLIYFFSEIKENDANIADQIIVWLIKKVDEDHYKNMLKVCGFEDKLVSGERNGKSTHPVRENI